jgi:Epoxide hydrolase N terminus
MMSPDITPFGISVSDDVLADLQTRLNLARFPKSLMLSVEKAWSYGVPTQNVQDLVEYWKKSFNWRKIETDINTKLPQFTTPIDAEKPHGILTIHFVHKRSPNPNAVPLLFSHGWPGNFLEVSSHFQGEGARLSIN